MNSKSAHLEQNQFSLWDICPLYARIPKLIFHMFAALAEFERNLIRERTQAGLKAARARGRLGGRPMALKEDKRKLAVSLYHKKEHSVAKICEMMGISKPTLYKYIEAQKTSDKAKP
ncbi:MAG: recombinase family protein [Bacteroidota bacterium]